jgi:hypothetical protein
MTKKEFAKEYARLGWKVFPVYEIGPDGLCTCPKHDLCDSPGKHPRTRNGRNDATQNEYQINVWWSDAPNANIGVATGIESGLIVIDVDDGGEPSLEGKYLPATVEAITGGGGRHLLYKHPGNAKIKNAVKPLQGIDSRADGGYIIVAPSNHISGGEYEWKSSPFENQLAIAPPWWINLLKTQKIAEKAQTNEGDEIVIRSGSRNATLASMAGSMRKLGMGYNAILSALLNVRCDPPLDESEIERIAKSICGYPIDDDPEATRIGEESAVAILETAHEIRKENLKNTPEPDDVKPIDIMPKSGLIRDIALYILSQSELPQPDLAVAGAAVYVGAIMGRQVQSKTGLLTNLSFVGLADSGAGKDKARSIIKRIAAATDTTWAIGPDRVSSGAALRAVMKDSPSTAMYMDEFGLKLESATNLKAANHERDTITTLMELYSAAQSSDNGTAYADPAMRKRFVIHRPCLCLYGTTTHKPFFDALSSGQGENGFLARLIVVDAGHTRPEWQDYERKDIPQAIIDGIQAILDQGGDLSRADGTINPDPLVIPYTPEVEKSVRDLAAIGIVKYMTSDHAKSIYNRVVENAIKLALAHAISRGVQAIDDESWIWGRDIALRSAGWMVRAVQDHVSDTLTEKYYKKLLAFVKSCGEHGVTKRDLLRKFTMLRKYERDELLQDLLANEHAIVIDRIAKNGRNTPYLVHYSFIST